MFWRHAQRLNRRLHHHSTEHPWISISTYFYLDKPTKNKLLKPSNSRLPTLSICRSVYVLKHRSNWMLVVCAPMQAIIKAANESWGQPTSVHALALLVEWVWGCRSPIHACHDGLSWISMHLEPHINYSVAAVTVPCVWHWEHPWMPMHLGRWTPAVGKIPIQEASDFGCMPLVVIEFYRERAR